MEKLSLYFDPKQFAVAFGAAVGATASPPSQEDIAVWLEGGVGVAGPGFAWGHGQVTYRGDNHAFGVLSLSVADAGPISIHATGRVMRLTKIADFDGRYLASGTRSLAAGGGLASHLQNERGVVIELVATDAATAASRSIDTLCVRLNTAKLAV